MILQEQLLFAAPAGVVEHALLEYLRVSGLQAESSAAYEEGAELLIRAGVGAVTKKLAVRTLPPYVRGTTTVIPIRWEATGPLGDLFPTLDANIELDAVDETSTRITLIGSYEPPLGRFGERLDHLLMGQVARATARGFLERLESVVKAAT